MIRKNLIFLFAALALFIAIAKLPYGYYQLLRFFVCGVSIYAFSLNYAERHAKWLWIFGGIAVLFNPVFAVHLEKNVWITIDLAVGFLFCLYFGFQMKSGQRKR